MLTRVTVVASPAGSATAGARHVVAARLPRTATMLATVYTPPAFRARCNIGQ